MQDNIKTSLLNTNLHEGKEEHPLTITASNVRKSSFRLLTTSVLLASSLVLISACSDGDDDDDDNSQTIVDNPFIGPPIPDDSNDDPNGDDDGDDDEDDEDDGDDGDDGDAEGNGDMMGGDDGDDDAVQETINDDGTSMFIVPLDAEQRVPPLDLPQAEAEGRLTIDRNSGVISGAVETEGLTGPAQAAHIRRGFAGQRGPIIVTLDLDTDGDGDEFTVPDVASLDSDGLMALANGELYISVQTVQNSTGEVRGQIIPEGVLLEDSELSGGEMVPPTDAEGEGVGFSTVNEDSGAINATIFLSDVSNVTSVTIHVGAEGENGNMVLALTRDETDINIWRTTEGSVLTEEQIEAYEDESLYFLVTTSTFANGAIRGQL